MPCQKPGRLWGASQEWREAPAGMWPGHRPALHAKAAGYRPVSSHFKGCLARSKRASPGAQVGASCARQHVVRTTHTPEGTGVPFSRSSEQRAPASPLSATRARLSSTCRPQSHQQLPPLAISKANNLLPDPLCQSIQYSQGHRGHLPHTISPKLSAAEISTNPSNL